MSAFVVCAMYRFVAVPDGAALRDPLLNVMREHGVKGTLLLAPEGINGTVAGTREGIDALLHFLEHDDIFGGRFTGIVCKESPAEAMPFIRTKVRLKREIVTMNAPSPGSCDSACPSGTGTFIYDGAKPGRYVKPGDWNALISDPEVLLIDTRNDYEVELGTFKGAVNPETDSFCAFPEYVKDQLDPAKHKKVAMFCTGGIRCEKSTAYLNALGFEAVFHLEGGILKYLEEVPADQSMWEGECFVFDDRVSVDHELQKGSYELCYACRMPIDAADKASEQYEKGMSCPRCFGTLDDATKARFAQRQLQVELARQRGAVHLGDAADVSRDDA